MIDCSVLSGYDFPTTPAAMVKSVSVNSSDDNFPTQERMMNISDRSKYALCQLLELFSVGKIDTLLRKYGLQAEELENYPIRDMQIGDVPVLVRDEILQSPPPLIENVLKEFGMKHNSFRQDVNPRYRFDQHWQDLCRNLYLDGYRVEKISESSWTYRYEFIPIEPQIDSVKPVEDDLTKEIRRSGLPNSDDICRMLDESAQAFCGEDFTGCLAKTRVALETIVKEMAKSKQGDLDDFDERHGASIASLRKSGCIDEKEESCLTGAYGLISKGVHTPVGLNEKEFVRLGRNLSLNCCYFLIKRFNLDR